MGLEKGIKHGKEHRDEYRGAKSIAKSCRNHGDCPWCKMNRLHKSISEDQRTIDEINDYKNGEYDDEETN